MAARQQAPSAMSSRVNEDFEPSTDWIREEEVDTLLVYLPGFRKEQLRVQLTTSRVLKISGECQVGDNRWKRFVKEVPVPPNCDTKEITAKFEGGILYIRQPKLITPAEQQGQVKPTVEAPKPQPPPTSKPSPQQVPSSPPQDKKLDGSLAANNIPQQSQERVTEKRSNSKDAPPKTAEKEKEKDEKEVGPKKEGRQKREEEEKLNGTVDYDTRKMEEATQQKGSEGGEAEGRKSVSGHFFAELKKPENTNKLIVIVVTCVVLGMFIINMLKPCKCDNQEL